MYRTTSVLIGLLLASCAAETVSDSLGEGAADEGACSSCLADFGLCMEDALDGWEQTWLGCEERLTATCSSDCGAPSLHVRSGSDEARVVDATQLLGGHVSLDVQMAIETDSDGRRFVTSDMSVLDLASVPTSARAISLNPPIYNVEDYDPLFGFRLAYRLRTEESWSEVPMPVDAFFTYVQVTTNAALRGMWADPDLETGEVSFEFPQSPDGLLIRVLAAPLRQSDGSDVATTSITFQSL